VAGDKVAVENDGEVVLADAEDGQDDLGAVVDETAATEDVERKSIAAVDSVTAVAERDVISPGSALPICPKLAVSRHGRSSSLSSLSSKPAGTPAVALEVTAAAGESICAD